MFKATQIHISLLLMGLICLPSATICAQINRELVVGRHRVNVSAFDSLSSLTVGNGKFAFTVDATGLQSFPTFYENGIPLGTQSEWGWHSFPDTADFKYEETLVPYPFYGRQVPYAVQMSTPERAARAVNYFRQNPHRLHLGHIGFEFSDNEGNILSNDAITNIHQTLDPWTGEITSEFMVLGKQVKVITYGHANQDAISAKVESRLIELGRLKIKLTFSYPTGLHTDSGVDWQKPEAHTSTLTSHKKTAKIHRTLDNDHYEIYMNWNGNAKVSQSAKHSFYLEPSINAKELSFTCLFTQPSKVKSIPSFKQTGKSSKSAWKKFWMSGGAVDFSHCKDPRAFEIERRMVLSQYLTNVQCLGKYPPQETGLTYNSWHGKFHLEMHWWHATHFALWGRGKLMEKSLDYYLNILPMAKSTAVTQGFEGVRWPKMTSPSGRDSPSSVGSFLIWQQPHFIYLSEILYAESKNKKFLEKYKEIVFETADFMASFAHYDPQTDRYILGPNIIPAQERFPATTTINPVFELLYWKWGLSTAQQWRERLDLPRNKKWDDIIAKISKPIVQNGLYLGAESAPDSYTNPQYLTDHPMVSGSYGMLPAQGMIDQDTMRATFQHVWQKWHWQETWGWDFPMTAMSATRLGLPEQAVEALLMPIETNKYLPNGHNYQNKTLRLYLPGNGAFLTAIALMCAGDINSTQINPGFPKDGNWDVRWEGLIKMQ